MAYLKYRLDLMKKYDGTHSIFPFVTIYPEDNISGIYIFLKCAEFYMFMPVMNVFLSTICSSVREMSPFLLFCFQQFIFLCFIVLTQRQYQGELEFRLMSFLSQK